MAPERNKDVVQSGTLIVLRERIRFIWASNTAGVITFVSVWNLCTVQRMRRKPTSNPGRAARETLFMWDRMPATRWRLICPQAFETRQARGPANSCLWSLSRSSLVATFCFCFAELHQVCHHGPTDRQYQMRSPCWWPWTEKETHVPKQEKEQTEECNCARVPHWLFSRPLRRVDEHAATG